MRKEHRGLTDLSIKRMPFAEKGQLKVRDGNLAGFGLIVGKRTKSFFVMTGQDRKTVVIGRYPGTSLAEARRKAMRVLSHNQPQTRSLSSFEALTTYLEHCLVKNKPRTVEEYRKLLKDIPDKPLSDITRQDLPNPTSHHIMAWRVFFNWAIRNELVDKNPFAFMPVKYGERHRVLNDEELKAIWQYEHPPYSNIVKLLLLTGQRRSQIWKLQPDWLAGNLVTFPAEIMKGNRPHTIPLSPSALELTKHAPFSFNSWSKNKVRLDKVTGLYDWTIHDLRRTHSTISARIGIPIHVEERILDHRTGAISGVSAVYNRHNYLEEMSQAVLQYEDYIRSLVRS